MSDIVKLFQRFKLQLHTNENQCKKQKENNLTDETRIKSKMNVVFSIPRVKINKFKKATPTEKYIFDKQTPHMSNIFKVFI